MLLAGSFLTWLLSSGTAAAAQCFPRVSSCLETGTSARQLITKSKASTGQSRLLHSCFLPSNVDFEPIDDGRDDHLRTLPPPITCTSIIATLSLRTRIPHKSLSFCQQYCAIRTYDVRSYALACCLLRLARRTSNSATIRSLCVCAILE